MFSESDYLCDLCGQPVRFEFHVDPDLWEKVTDAKDRELGDPYDGGEGYLCLCLRCFAVKALQKGITSFHVNDLCFVPLEE